MDGTQRNAKRLCAARFLLTLSLYSDRLLFACVNYDKQIGTGKFVFHSVSPWIQITQLQKLLVLCFRALSLMSMTFRENFISSFLVSKP